LAGVTTTTETRLTQQYFQLVEINRFVETCVSDGQERQVLDYMLIHFNKLAEAEKAMHFSKNVALWRVYILNQDFIDKSCVIPEHMWECNLTIPARKNMKAIGNGGDSNGGGGSSSGGSSGNGNRAAISKAVGIEVAKALEKSGNGGGGGGGGHHKYGHAPFLAVYRTSNTDIHGKPYLNRYGQPYKGSIDDRCEADGESRIYQHPLRCNRCNPGWKEAGKAPELNGVTTWWIRGGGEAKLGDTGVAGD
jgi:hypothetical protein